MVSLSVKNNNDNKLTLVHLYLFSVRSLEGNPPQRMASNGTSSRVRTKPSVSEVYYIDKTEVVKCAHQWWPGGNRDYPSVLGRGRGFCFRCLKPEVLASKAARQVTSFLAIIVD